MPGTAPAPVHAPQSRSGVPRNTPASSKGTVLQQHRSRPGITTALQGSTRGLKPLPGWWVGSGSLQGGGEFLTGGCVGLAPRSRVMAAQTMGPSCCPLHTPCGNLVGARELPRRPRLVGSIPQPTWGLPAASQPPSTPPSAPRGCLHPQSEVVHIQLAEAREAAPPGHRCLGHLAAATGCQAGPQSWDRQGKRVTK